MNVCHEEIDSSSELSGHDGSSVRCTNGQLLVETPCSLPLSDVGYSGQNRRDRSGICCRCVESSIGVVQDEFVSNNDLLVSVVKIAGSLTHSFDHAGTVGLECALDSSNLSIVRIFIRVDICY